VPELTSPESSGGHSIRAVAEADLADLVPLMRAYCDFYRVAPSDHALLGLSRALLGDPGCEGLQLIARDADGSAVGFATIFWSWSTTSGGRIGIMHDLYVSPDARGLRAGERLIRACMERCAERGALRLEWQTAPDNLRAQALLRSRWRRPGTMAQLRDGGRGRRDCQAPSTGKTGRGREVDWGALRP
jgi:ribosomal protein S18 acetylase RimI-like enzyme